MRPYVSVVVPTYKRPALLRRCLLALLAQDYDPSMYEIIVTDDAACAETQQLVEELVSTHEARHVYQHGAQARLLACHTICTLSEVQRSATPLAMSEQRTMRYLPVRGAHGPAAARNAGWHVARGALIAFTDDDCVPEPGWVRAYAEAMMHDAAGASGRVIVPLTAAPTDYERDAAGLANGQFVTANCCYRRDALSAVGGFDERFTIAWREDSDLHFTMLQRGYRLCHAPDAVVVHPIRPASWGVSLRQQRKSQFNALLYKKHPQLYRRHIQPAPPWHYYGALGGLMGTLIGVLGRRRWLAMLGIGVWILQTGRFCARRLQGASHSPAHIAEMLTTSALIPPIAIFWRLCGAIRYRVLFL
jgi:cellulose synthase/poly-beta-1,6-N-acetylglucosamine synthase-like glycosyltransferase